MTWPEAKGTERRTLQNFLLMSLKSRWAGLGVAVRGSSKAMEQPRPRPWECGRKAGLRDLPWGAPHPKTTRASSFRSAVIKSCGLWRAWQPQDPGKGGIGGVWGRVLPPVFGWLLRLWIPK